MRAHTHIWIARRAVELLEQEEDAAALPALLRRHEKELWLGAAWLPDVCFGDAETAHVCRTMPAADTDALPQRVAKLFRDAVAHLVAPDGLFADSKRALALYVLSHYITDANCPLHVDPRLGRQTMQGLPPSLHHSLEEAWEAWFVTDGGDPVCALDGDSPLSIVPATATARCAAAPSPIANAAYAARRIVERTRRLSLRRIPDGCADLAQLHEALGPRGLEMLAAEAFACAAADTASFWQAVWSAAVAHTPARAQRPLR